MNARLKLRAVSAAALLLQGFAATHATTLYWDADGDASNNNVDGTGLGGVGTWSSANSWWNGVDANQNWVDSSDAVIVGGTAGTINLGANVTASSLQFGTTGYTVNMNNYNLTLNGIGGVAGTIGQTTANTKTLTLNIASGTNTWGGTINGRFNVSKNGAGTLELSGSTTTTFTYNTLSINGGTVRLLTGAVFNSGGGYIDVANGATLDAGSCNNVIARAIRFYHGSTVTGVSGAKVIDENQYDATRLMGKLTGAVAVQMSANGPFPGMFITGNDNDQTGDVTISGNNRSPQIVASANSALGTGRVILQNTGTGTGTLFLRSAAPTLGSLETSGTGNRAVTLGNSGVDLAAGTLKARWATGSTTIEVRAAPWGVTTEGLSIGQVITSANGIPTGATITAITGTTTFTISDATTNAKTSDTNIGASPIDTTVTAGALNRTSDTFSGVIQQASGAVGSVTKVGTGEWSLSGANTYTDTTRVENGTLRVTHATAGLAACKVQVAGGTFAGPASSGTGVVRFNLGDTPDSGFVMTSGALDLSRVGLDFTGPATLKSYTLLDYSAGGTLTTATGVPTTANTFASATNVPDGYKWAHDTVGKTITLFLPSDGTVLMIR